MKKIGMKYWPVVVIFFAWFVFSSPYLLRGLVPFPSRYLVSFFPPWSAQYGMALKNNAMPDVATQIYPWKKITIDTWKQGQVPLWNPYSFSGTPHAANYQTAVFSPVNLLYFVLPFFDAWSVSILLQPLLAGVFMYVLLRCLDRSKEGSLIGAVAFMFCGFLTVWMAYGTLGWAVLWLPFIFAGVLLHIDKRAWWRPVMVAVGIAWSFVSGHFQMSVYVLMAAASFTLYESIKTRRWRAGLELGFAIALGLMLAAPQILPSLEAYRGSVRSELFASAGGINFQHLITMFAPDFFGNPVTRNDWFGFYAEWASYVGVVPLLLVVYSIIRPSAGEAGRTKHIGFFLSLSVISLALATPTPLNAFISWLKLPAISTSYGARIIILTGFSFAVLSAYGLDGVREDWEKRKRSSALLLTMIIGLFLICVWAVVMIIRPFPVDKLLIARRNLLLPSGLSLGCIALVFMGFIRKRRVVHALVVGLLVALTIADMLRYAGKWMPFDPREYVYPDMRILTYLQAQIGHDRMFGNFGGEVTNGFGIFGIEGYDAVYQKRYGEFIRSTSRGKIITPERSIVQFPKIGDYTEKTLAILGVRYIAHRLSDARNSWAYPYWNYSQYASIYRDEHYEVFENAHALPRALLASSYVVRTVDQDIMDMIYSDDFDPKTTVILEKEPDLNPEPGEGSADIVRYTPNEVIIKTSSGVQKMLYLSDVFDTGWKVSIDGISTTLYRANYDFRAVEVPPGAHTIRMVYWPESFVAGMWTAVGGVILLLFLSFSVHIRRYGSDRSFL